MMKTFLTTDNIIETKKYGIFWCLLISISSTCSDIWAEAMTPWLSIWGLQLPGLGLAHTGDIVWLFVGKINLMKEGRRMGHGQWPLQLSDLPKPVSQTLYLQAVKSRQIHLLHICLSWFCLSNSNTYMKTEHDFQIPQEDFPQNNDLCSNPWVRNQLRYTLEVDSTFQASGLEVERGRSHFLRWWMLKDFSVGQINYECVSLKFNKEVRI